MATIAIDRSIASSIDTSFYHTGEEDNGTSEDYRRLEANEFTINWGGNDENNDHSDNTNDDDSDSDNGDTYDTIINNTRKDWGCTILEPIRKTDENGNEVDRYAAGTYPTQFFLDSEDESQDRYKDEDDSDDTDNDNDTDDGNDTDDDNDHSTGSNNSREKKPVLVSTKKLIREPGPHDRGCT